MDVNSISKLCFTVEGLETVAPTAVLKDGTEKPLALTFGALVARAGKIPFEFRSKFDGELKRAGQLSLRARDCGKIVAMVVNDNNGTRFSDREADQPFMMAIDGQYD